MPVSFPDVSKKDGELFAFMCMLLLTISFKGKMRIAYVV